MKKIISLFQRNYDGDKLVRDEIVPGAEWVVEGLGIATRKFDGTCCLVRDGKLYKRYELRKGSKPPSGFEPATDIDSVTGKQQGWVPVGDGPDDKWHREALTEHRLVHFGLDPSDGTYELCGPKVQGNPEGYPTHNLVPHGCEVHPDCPRDFAGLKAYLAGKTWEGVVWHNPDGRMVKIKRKDFGK